MGPLNFDPPPKKFGLKHLIASPSAPVTNLTPVTPILRRKLIPVIETLQDDATTRNNRPLTPLTNTPKHSHGRNWRNRRVTFNPIGEENDVIQIDEGQTPDSLTGMIITPVHKPLIRFNKRKTASGRKSTGLQVFHARDIHPQIEDTPDEPKEKIPKVEEENQVIEYVPFDPYKDDDDDDCPPSSGMRLKDSRHLSHLSTIRPASRGRYAAGTTTGSIGTRGTLMSDRLEVMTQTSDMLSGIPSDAPMACHMLSNLIYALKKSDLDLKLFVNRKTLKINVERKKLFLNVQKIQTEYSKSLLTTQIINVDGYGTEDEFELSGQKLKIVLEPKWVEELELRVSTIIRIVSPFIIWKNSAGDWSLHDPLHIQIKQQAAIPENHKQDSKETEEVIFETNYHNIIL